MLYSSLLPAADTQLGYLEQLHGGDSRRRYARIERFANQWTVVRNLLSPVHVPLHPAPALAAALTAAYQPVGATLDQILLTEQLDGPVDRANVVAEWAHRHGQPFALTVTGPAGGIYAHRASHPKPSICRN